MRRPLLAVVALLVGASLLVSPGSTAAEGRPQPGANGIPNATPAEVGMPTAAQVQTALGWPAAHPLTVTAPTKVCTYAWRPYWASPCGSGAYWRPQTGLKFDSDIRYADSSSATAPDGPSVVPSHVKLRLVHTEEIRDHRMHQERYLIDSLSTRVYPIADGVTAFNGRTVTTMVRAGRNALVFAECRRRAGATVEDSRHCSEELAALVQGRFEARWPAISDRWPSPTQPLVQTSHVDLWEGLLNARDVRSIGRMSTRLSRDVICEDTDNHCPDANLTTWGVRAKYKTPRGVTKAVIDVYSLYYVAAARTEVWHQWRSRRGYVVRTTTESVTTYRRGSATTWRRVDTGVVKATCRLDRRLAAIDCSRRLAVAQAARVDALL